MVIKIFNSKLPFGIAATGVDRRVNSAVELASLKVAQKFDILYVLNLLSSITIEEAAQFSPDSLKFLETYPFKDQQITEVLVQKVEKAKFGGIIISTNETEFSFFPSIEGIDTEYKPVIIHDLLEQGLLETNCSDRILSRESEQFWHYINWISEITKLPVLLKGNFSASQVRRALQQRISGFCITNPAIDELIEIQSAIGKQVPLMVSGDVICEKISAEYLKLGVDMVFIERAIQWGFTIDGQKGIEDVVQLFKNANK